MLVFFHLPILTRTLLISLVALLTLIGIMIRPFKLNEAMIAMAGAALLLIVGLINPLDALTTLTSDWNTFFFFLGMMSLSALAEAAGLFDWLAAQAAQLAGGSSKRLLLNTFLLGSMISMVLSNDATALILTPIVYTLVTRLRLPVLPFLFACTFIADTASFLLPVSNPINIIILSAFRLDLWTFLRLLFLPSLVVIGINFAIFFLLYRRQVQGSFDAKRLPSAAESIRHRGYFRYTCVVILLVALAYIIASAWQVPPLAGRIGRRACPVDWRAAVETDYIQGPWRANLVVYFRIYRRHVYRRTCGREHAPYHAIWAVADSSLRRNELWSRSGRHRRSSTWHQFD